MLHIIIDQVSLLNHAIQKNIFNKEKNLEFYMYACRLHFQANLSVLSCMADFLGTFLFVASFFVMYHSPGRLI